MLTSDLVGRLPKEIVYTRKLSMEQAFIVPSAFPRV